MLYNASLAAMFSTDVTLTNKRTVKKPSTLEVCVVIGYDLQRTDMLT